MTTKPAAIFHFILLTFLYILVAAGAIATALMHSYLMKAIREEKERDVHIMVCPQSSSHESPQLFFRKEFNREKIWTKI